jgi:hypothetical protein
MRKLTRRVMHRDDRGAVAIMVALLAGVLVIVSALSVDLGNAWARGRIVQKQADIAALAAGSLLPMSSTDARTDNEPDDIAARAVDYLNDNKASGQDDAVASQLVDNDFSNGELQFFHDDGSACTDICTQLTLTPPQAYVDFGLAGAVASGTNVTRSATVRAFSELPRQEDVVPFWIPSGCGYGPVDADTSNGGGPSPRPAPAWAAKAAAAPIPISPVGTHTMTNPALTYDVAYNGSLDFRQLKITNVPSSTTKATIRAISPDGLYFNEYASADIKSNATTFNVDNFTVSTELTSVPGTWKLYALIDDGGVKYSSNFVEINVAQNPASPSPTTESPTGTATTGSPSGPSSSDTTTTATATTTSVPVGCVGQDRGNFGQLDSPRALSSEDGNNERLAYNLALGLDHLPVPYTFSDIQKECADQNGNNVISGNVRLDDESRAGNNCIISDEGNDGPQIFKGLISGIGGNPGRLDVVNGSTKAGCNGGDVSHGGYMINNDVLSCYLSGGATLADISAEDGVEDFMLDDSVKDSPRFCWLPVVLATDRAQKGYQPLVDYLPAFITDEDQVPTAASADNGLELQGNSVKVIRMFVFNKDALGPDQQSPDIDYDPDLGVANVRLVG